MNFWFRKYIFIFLFSFVASLSITPIIKIIAIRLGIMDRPNERKIHTHPIPLWGGLAIYAAYSLAILINLYYSAPLKIIASAGFIVLLLGAIDDVKNIPATIKFIVLVILTIWLSFYNIIVRFSGWYPVDLLVTILWVVGVTSAFNSIDNMDGLAAGIAFIAASLFAIVASTSNQWWFGVLSCALAGATLGFLKYNFKPAKIFLGNGGSMFLGFTLAAIAVMGEWSNNRLIAFTIPILILAIPIFDIIYVVIRRQAEGITKSLKEILNYSGKDHLSHRLEALGLSRKRVVVLLYFLSICLGLGAIMLRAETYADVFLLFMQMGFIIASIVILLNIRMVR